MKGPPEAQIAVVVPTVDRWPFVTDLLETLAAQTLLPVEVVLVSPEAPADVYPDFPTPLATVVSPRGLTIQRNAGVRALAPGARYVAFLDDDLVLHPDYLRAAVAVLESDPKIIGLTGRLALDGVAARREIPQAEARSALAASVVDPARRSTRSLYGCNFVVRWTVLQTERFDERLPLYGWLDDRDFAGRAARHGELVVADSCVAVHRGARSGGRVAHRRFGYSQVMNPVYLRRKGTIGRADLARLLLKGLPVNAASLIVGRDRRPSSARLRGNLLACRDLAAGRVIPERAAQL